MHGPAYSVTTEYLQPVEPVFLIFRLNFPLIDGRYTEKLYEQHLYLSCQFNLIKAALLNIFIHIKCMLVMKSLYLSACRTVRLIQTDKINPAGRNVSSLT